MAGDWINWSLGQLCDLRAGTVFKPAFQGKTSGNYPFIKVSDMNLPANAVKIQDSNNWVSGGDLLALKAKPFPPGTVVFAKIGEALRQNRLRHVVRETVIDNNMMGAVPDRSRVDPIFFYYALSQFDFAKIAQGTALPYLTVTSLSALALDVPPVPEQRAIAHILGTLDDKIELNRRMNETLEAIARAIFKSWFVDFDPVHAKASGEPPESICRRLGLTPDLLALFPDRLVDSELGEIPEGWEVKTLSQITSYLNRGIAPKYMENGGVLVLNQKCVRDGRVDTSKARRHDPEQRSVAGRLLEVGDVLVNSTGVGTLGRVAQVLALDEPTIVDSHVTVVRADAQEVSWNYLGVALLERETEIEALGEGSTGQTELSRSRLSDLKLTIPPSPLRERFDKSVLPLRLQTKRNDEQAATLASIRDGLLPKLLSGELRVPLEATA